MQAIGNSGRHIFWTLGQMQRPRPFFRMGDDAANRLDGLSIEAIQNRILIDPAVQRYVAAKADLESKQGTRGFRSTYNGGLSADPAQTFLSAQIPSLTDDEKAVLTAIQAGPTDEELADLSLIDGFFQGSGGATNPGFQQKTFSLTEGVCAALNPESYRKLGMAFGSRPLTPPQSIVQWLQYAPPRTHGWTLDTVQPNASSDELDAIKDSSFFCATPQSWPYPNDIHLDFASWFAVNPDQTWGQVKRQVKNAATMMKVIWSYPFPPPIDQSVFQWWVTTAPDLQKYAAGDPIDPEGFRFWITLSVLTNYDDMVSRIEADLKRKEKKAKRKNMMKMIGIAIAGIIAPYLLPVLVVAAAVAIKAAIDTYMQIEARKKAAKDMADAAKLFANDAPAFSTEVRNLGDMFDAQEAQAEASTPLPPDVEAEVGAPPVEGVHPLVIGGGIAAAVGIAALAIFR